MIHFLGTLRHFVYFAYDPWDWITNVSAATIQFATVILIVTGPSISSSSPTLTLTSNLSRRTLLPSWNALSDVACGWAGHGDSRNQSARRVLG